MHSSTNSIFDPHNIQDVIWIQTAFAGDIVLSTAAMKLLYDQYPHIQQHVITTPIGQNILEGVSFLTSTHALPKSFSWNSIKELYRLKKSLKNNVKQKKTTLTLQPHRSPRSSLLRMLLGYQSCAWSTVALAQTTTYTVTPHQHEHETMRVAKLLTPLGVNPLAQRHINPYLEALPLKSSSPWQHKLQEHTGVWIALAPGSVWGTKQWQISKYIELAHTLLEKTQAHILWIGGPQEKNLKAYIPRDHPRMIDTIGDTSFDDLRRIFPRLQLLVSNDSSPVHFASAFQVPTVTIWGATAPQLGFHSLSAKQKQVERSLPCRPCHSHGPQTCPKGHFKCMNEIAVDMVMQACLDILDIKAS